MRVIIGYFLVMIREMLSNLFWNPPFPFPQGKHSKKEMCQIVEKFQGGRGVMAPKK